MFEHEAIYNHINIQVSIQFEYRTELFCCAVEHHKLTNALDKGGWYSSHSYRIAYRISNVVAKNLALIHPMLLFPGRDKPRFC